MFQISPTTAMGLPGLEWQTYEVVVGTTATPLFPPAALAFTTTVSTVLPAIGVGLAGTLLSISLGANATKWVRPGMVVSISGCTGDDILLNAKYQVYSVTPSTGVVVLRARDHTGLVATHTPDGTPVLNLLAGHAQKAYIKVPAAGATVTISPDEAGLNNTYGWTLAIAAAAERELFAPAGGKFSLADWYGKVAASTQTVQVLFV